MPILTFVEASIYQIDEANEHACALSLNQHALSLKEHACAPSVKTNAASLKEHERAPSVKEDAGCLNAYASASSPARKRQRDGGQAGGGARACVAAEEGSECADEVEGSVWLNSESRGIWRTLVTVLKEQVWQKQNYSFETAQPHTTRWAGVRHTKSSMELKCILLLMCPPFLRSRSPYYFYMCLHCGGAYMFPVRK